MSGEKIARTCQYFTNSREKISIWGKGLIKRTESGLIINKITEQISWFSTNKAIYPQNLMSYPQATNKNVRDEKFIFLTNSKN